MCGYGASVQQVPVILPDEEKAPAQDSNSSKDDPPAGVDAKEQLGDDRPAPSIEPMMSVTSLVLEGDDSSTANLSSAHKMETSAVASPGEAGAVPSKDKVVPQKAHVTALQEEFRLLVRASSSLDGLSWQDFVRMSPSDTANFKNICQTLRLGPKLALLRIHAEVTA